MAEAVKPRYGGIFSSILQYGGNDSAVGDLSFFGGKTLAVGGITTIWRLTAILPGPPTRAVIPRRQLYRRPS